MFFRAKNVPTIDIPALLAPHKLEQVFSAKSDYVSVLGFKFQDLMRENYPKFQIHVKTHPDQVREVFSPLYDMDLQSGVAFKKDITNHINMDWSYGYV